MYLQQSLRRAADYITHEVRYATEFEQLTTADPFPSAPGDVAEGDNYIYYGGESDPRIFQLNNKRLLPLTDPVVTGFTLSTVGHQFFFTITAEEGGEEYTIDTMVLLLNTHPMIKDEEEVEFIPAIRYSSPDRSVLSPQVLVPYPVSRQLCYCRQEQEGNGTAGGKKIFERQWSRAYLCGTPGILYCFGHRGLALAQPFYGLLRRDYSCRA
ncbi:MAG: hypothetical protein WBK24_01440 [Dethiobacteria bacterium]